MSFRLFFSAAAICFLISVRSYIIKRNSSPCLNLQTAANAQKTRCKMEHILQRFVGILDQRARKISRSRKPISSRMPRQSGTIVSRALKIIVETSCFSSGMPSSGASSDSPLRSFWKARARASFCGTSRPAHQTAALRQLRKLQCSSLRLVLLGGLRLLGILTLPTARLALTHWCAACGGQATKWFGSDLLPVRDDVGADLGAVLAARVELAALRRFAGLAGCPSG